MPKVTIAVDLAKDVFEVAVSPAPGRIGERRRMSRSQFEQYWSKRDACRVVMEACSSAHFWARWLIGHGYEVVLLPPQYVAPYRRRNKTDRSDCEAILEADRCSGIRPVSIKSPAQQSILALHRARSQWMATRTARINGMRGLLREHGVVVPKGADRLLRRFHERLEGTKEQVPEAVRRMVLLFWEEVQELEERVAEAEAQLSALARQDPVIRALLKIPGVGVLTATALYASVGNVAAFKSGRHLASWLGITPKENSSGGRRKLGRITKQGDAYVRTLLIHGARSALNAARLAQRTGRRLTHLQAWALERDDEGSTNRAAVALANKLARIIWAVWRYERSFDGDHALKPAT
jgi:transposase